MYTLADAVRLQGARARALGGGRPRPVAGRRRRAERRRRRRRPDRGRDASARSPSSTGASFAEDYRGLPQEQARLDPRRGGADALHDVQAGPPRLHAARRSRSAASRSWSARRVAVGRADARHAQVGNGAEGAHARLGRRPAGEPDRASRSGVELERGNRVPVGPGPDASTATPRCSRSATSPGSRTRRRTQVLPQLGSVALQSGERAGENIARLVDGQGDGAVRLQRQGDDGDDRPRRRRRAVPRRPDDEGQGGVARLGRRAPRAAARPARTAPRRSSTGPGPGFTHERPGRISVRHGREELGMTTRAAATAHRAGHERRRRSPPTCS